MGIDLFCGDIALEYSNDTWKKICMIIVNSWFQYIKEVIKDYDPININVEYRYHIIIFNMVKYYTENPSENIINYLNSLYTNENNINAFSAFNIIGIFKLLYDSDCERVYSPGDSYDIYNLFILIEQYISYENYIIIKDIIIIFKTGYELNEHVLLY